MGMIGQVLSLPLHGPLGAVTWIARQVAAAARQQLLDPTRIERELAALEKRLEAGLIDEAAFEEEEAALLQELAEIRLALATGDGGDEEAGDDEVLPLSASPADASQSGEIAPQEAQWTSR